MKFTIKICINCHINKEIIKNLVQLVNTYSLQNRREQYLNENDEDDLIEGSIETVDLHSTEHTINFVCEKTQDRQISTTVFRAWEIPSCQNTGPRIENEPKYRSWQESKGTIDLSGVTCDSEACSIDDENGKTISTNVISIGN